MAQTKQTQQTRKRNSKQRDNVRKQQRNLKQSGFTIADKLEAAQVDELRRAVRK